MTFQYETPADWEMASRLLNQDGSVAKMGGCDVLTRFRSGRLRAKLVVGLHRLPGVGDLAVNTNGARIGAAVTLQQLAQSREFAQGWPVIARTAATIASPAIRGAATLVGNIAQGWSVSDLVPLLQVCDAELEIRGASGTRRLSVIDYTKQPRNVALKPGEMIAALEVMPLGTDSRLAYERFAFKDAFDLPLVSAAVRVAISDGKLQNVKIAIVGGKAMPALCEPAASYLNGRSLDAGVIEEASKAAIHWADPPSDFRASAAYRRHLVGEILGRALKSMKAQESIGS
jgi:carbon-monoxide dehydrogenase medium subunit